MSPNRVYLEKTRRWFKRLLKKKHALTDEHVTKIGLRINSLLEKHAKVNGLFNGYEVGRSGY